MMSSKKSTWCSRIWVVIRLSFGFFLLFVTIKLIEWQALKNIFKNLEITWLLLAVATVILGLLLKIFRWRLLLINNQVKLSFWDISTAFFIGQALNIMMPFRGGEFIRIGWISGKQLNTISRITTTVVFEKIFDGVALLLLFLFLSSNLPEDLRIAGLKILYPAALTLIVVFIVLFIFRKTIWSHIRNFLYGLNMGNWIKELIKILDQWYLDSTKLINTKKNLSILFITFIIWSIMAFTNIFVMLAVHIPPDYQASFMVLLFLYLGLLPGLMPGNIGPFYFFSGTALALYSVNQQDRLAFSVLLHAIVTLPPLVIAAVQQFIIRKEIDKMELVIVDNNDSRC